MTNYWIKCRCGRAINCSPPKPVMCRCGREYIWKQGKGRKGHYVLVKLPKK